MSEYYGIEIVAVDTLSLKSLRFGENRKNDVRIFLIYDGIHYDPLVLDFMNGSTDYQTFFSVRDDKAFEMAGEIAQEARSCRQYTDINNFTLKCMICEKQLRGNVEAKEHALATKHCEFGEI